MAVYSVFAPPGSHGAGPDSGDGFVFVRDGFSWGAFVLGPLWMLWRGLWLALLIYVVGMIALRFGWRLMPAPNGVQFVVALLIALLLGLEGASLRRWKLHRRGWRDLGVVAADNLEAAERRFFDRWVTEPARVAPPPLPGAAAAIRSGHEPDVIGLFPQPGASR